MTELFPDIPQQIRDYAAFIWEQAKQRESPIEAVKLLESTTKIFEDSGLKEEADFLRFYFNLQMEMMKE